LTGGTGDNVLEPDTAVAMSPGNGSGTPVGIPLPPGVLANLRVALSDAPGSGQTVLIIVVINNSDSDITCTIADTDDTCSDLVNTAPLNGDEKITVEAVTSDAAVTTKIAFSLGFTLAASPGN
jgi:hypothetical protein